MTISTDDGYVNPAHVVKITYDDNDKTMLHLTDGTKQTTHIDVDEVAHMLVPDPVIPSQPGFSLLTAVRGHDGFFFQCIQDIVIAWSITSKRSSANWGQGIGPTHRAPRHQVSARSGFLPAGTRSLHHKSRHLQVGAAHWQQARDECHHPSAGF